MRHSVGAMLVVLFIVAGATRGPAEVRTLEEGESFFCASRMVVSCRLCVLILKSSRPASDVEAPSFLAPHYPREVTVWLTPMILVDNVDGVVSRGSIGSVTKRRPGT